MKTNYRYACISNKSDSPYTYIMFYMQLISIILYNIHGYTNWHLSFNNFLLFFMCSFVFSYTLKKFHLQMFKKKKRKGPIPNEVVNMELDY